MRAQAVYALPRPLQHCAGAEALHACRHSCRHAHVVGVGSGCVLHTLLKEDPSTKDPVGEDPVHGGCCAPAVRAPIP
jgi:hypothetical protein